MRARLVYLEVVDECAVVAAAAPPSALLDADTTRGGSPPSASSASAASEGMLHHSLVLAEGEFPALAADQALTVGWGALPVMLAQLLDAARVGGGGGGGGDGSVTPRSLSLPAGMGSAASGEDVLSAHALFQAPQPAR